jgi:hypothetical protein
MLGFVSMGAALLSTTRAARCFIVFLDAARRKQPEPEHLQADHGNETSAYFDEQQSSDRQLRPFVGLRRAVGPLEDAKASLCSVSLAAAC